MSAHRTPGSLSVDPEEADMGVVSAGEQEICCVSWDDACLFAAAPDLLDALQKCERVLCDNHRYLSPEETEVWKTTLAAIAKAVENG